MTRRWKFWDNWVLVWNWGVLRELRNTSVRMPNLRAKILRLDLPKNRSQWPARSKAWVCDLSSAEIVVSNPTGGMHVRLLLSVVCCQVQVSATSWSLVQRSPTYCGASLCVIEKPREWGEPGLLEAVAPETNKTFRRRGMDATESRQSHCAWFQASAVV